VMPLSVSLSVFGTGRDRVATAFNAIIRR